MKTIRCDRCGELITDGSYREITSGIRNHITNDSGVYTVTCEFRPPVKHDLCAICSRDFDNAFDDFVFKFLYEGRPKNV